MKLIDRVNAANEALNEDVKKDNQLSVEDLKQSIEYLIRCKVTDHEKKKNKDWNNLMIGDVNVVDLIYRTIVKLEGEHTPYTVGDIFRYSGLMEESEIKEYVNSIAHTDPKAYDMFTMMDEYGYDWRTNVLTQACARYEKETDSTTDFSDDGENIKTIEEVFGEMDFTEKELRDMFDNSSENIINFIEWCKENVRDDMYEREIMFIKNKLEKREKPEEVEEPTQQNTSTEVPEDLIEEDWNAFNIGGIPVVELLYYILYNKIYETPCREDTAVIDVEEIFRRAGLDNIEEIDECIAELGDPKTEELYNKYDKYYLTWRYYTLCRAIERVEQETGFTINLYRRASTPFSSVVNDDMTLNEKCTAVERDLMSNFIVCVSEGEDDIYDDENETPVEVHSETAMKQRVMNLEDTLRYIYDVLKCDSKKI